MKTALKIFIALLLLFNGTGAIYGGWSLMAYPDGSGLQMSLKYLENSPFTNYFIPGIILFIANGLFSFFVFSALLFRLKHYALLVVIQGLVLAGWILIQIMMVQIIVGLHIIMGLTGILLVICGWVWIRYYYDPASIK